MKSITYIIPIYKKTIDEVRRCLLSLQKIEKWANFLIINDADENIDFEILKKEFQNMLFYKNKENMGSNVGKIIMFKKYIKKIDTKYFQIIDPDDYIVSNHYQDFVREYLDNGELDVIFSTIFNKKQSKKFYLQLGKKKIRKNIRIFGPTATHKTKNILDFLNKNDDSKFQSVNIIDDIFLIFASLSMAKKVGINKNYPFYFYSGKATTSLKSMINKSTKLFNQNLKVWNTDFNLYESLYKKVISYQMQKFMTGSLVFNALSTRRPIKSFKKDHKAVKQTRNYIINNKNLRFYQNIYKITFLYGYNFFYITTIYTISLFVNK